MPRRCRLRSCPDWLRIGKFLAFELCIFQPKSDDLNLDVLQENGEIKYFGTLSGDPDGVIHGKTVI